MSGDEKEAVKGTVSTTTDVATADSTIETQPSSDSSQKRTESLQKSKAALSKAQAAVRPISDMPSNAGTRTPALNIRTYPEFEYTPTEPFSYITARKFWMTVYLIMGSTGIAMLFARFVLRPMYTALLKARKEYQNHVSSHLSRFAENLEKSVTNLPTRHVTISSSGNKFLVDSQTQTSPQHSPKLSPADTASRNGSSKDALSPDLSVLATSLTRLTEKIEPLKMLEEEALYTTASNKVTELKEYLHEFDSHNYRTYNSTSFSYGSNVSGDPAIQKVKAEIRSLKGSVLNARNFPSTVQK